MLKKFNVKPAAKLAALAGLLALGVASAQSMPWAPSGAASAPEAAGAPDGQGADGPHHHHRRPGPGGKRPGGPEGPGFEFLLDMADASPAQREEVRKIMRSSFEEGKSEHEVLRKLHEQMLALLAAPDIDAAAVEALRVQIQAQQEQQSKRMSAAMVACAKVLTPAQRSKLAQRMAEHREHPVGPEGRREHGLGGEPGRG